VFRPRLGQYVRSAIFMTVVVYAVFLFLGPSIRMPPYPFAFAAALGGASLIYNLVGDRAKHGIRVDANGLVDIHSRVVIEWAQITAIKLDVEPLTFPKGQLLARIATIEAGDKSIRFGDLGAYTLPRVGSVVNLEAAGVLLAIVAARTKAQALFPPAWNTAPAAAEPPLVTKVALQNLGGVAAFAVKVGPKLVGIVTKLVKSIKLGTVAFAIGAYSLIWSWQFGVALVVMVIVHECGHVFAMWRSGVQVKGIYFIPFFGGVAVGKGVAKTRAAAAYIAINGPIWGMLLAFACLAGFGLTHEPLFAALAAWGAILNLFNLLPIFPLDGGRIVASLVNASPRGVPIVVASLALGIGVAYFAKLELLALIGLIGLFELSGRITAATYASSLAMLGRDLSPDDHEAFTRHVALVEQGRDATTATEARKQTFAHLRAEAMQTPMTLRQGMTTLAGYLVVVGLLIALLLVTSRILGPGNPLELLR
jgi:Zn-dependent protease